MHVTATTGTGRTANRWWERGYWIVFSTVSALLVLPVLVVRYPPMHDYPNHLARVFILAHLRDVPAYEARWKPYPNLAMDAIVVPLQRDLDVDTASRIFLVSIPLLFLFGVHRLGRVLHGRPAPAAPLAAYVFFHTLYFYGFLNYVFGVGLFLLACGSRSSTGSRGDRRTRAQNP
jgi:hypothetical protein